MIVTAGLLRRAVERTLQAGLPAVLAQLAVQEGLDLPAIVSWHRMDDFRAIPERQAPALVVTAAGLAETPPPVAACRAYMTSWDVRLFVIARGRSYEQTADRVAAYAAAARAVLVAERRLVADDGTPLAGSVHWTAETYAEAPAIEATPTTRTVGAGSVTVTYGGVLTDTS